MKIWTALAEIFTMHSFVPFSNLNVFINIADFFLNFALKHANVAKIWQIFDELFASL